MDKFEGYDPLSPTLQYHRSVGHCMGLEWSNCEFWTDFALPVRSGDAVRFGVHYKTGPLAGRTEWMVKWLEYGEMDGAPGWWLQCRDGTFRIGAIGPFWMERVVARRRVPGGPLPCDPALLADGFSFRAHEDDSRAARLSWHLRGRQWGRELPRHELRTMNRPPGWSEPV